MKHVVSASLIVLAMVSSGCQSTGPKQQTGVLLGAVTGGLVGAQFGRGNGRVAASIVGAAIGGIIGGSIGAQLDAKDRARLKEITAASIKSGKSRSFRNSKTGVRASTKVVSERISDGKQCRTVQQNVTLPNGQISQDTVTGCKGPNGWSV